MRCPYHGPMTTRSRDRAIPAPPRPLGLRLPLLLLLLVLLSLAPCVSPPPPPAPAPAPLSPVSLDGLPPDSPNAGLAPTLSHLPHHRLRRTWMNPTASPPPLTPSQHH